MPNNLYEQVFNEFISDKEYSEQCPLDYAAQQVVGLDRCRLARSMILGGAHYDAGHSCIIVRRVTAVRYEILIEGKKFTVHLQDLMK